MVEKRRQEPSLGRGAGRGGGLPRRRAESQEETLPNDDAARLRRQSRSSPNRDLERTRTGDRELREQVQLEKNERLVPRRWRQWYAHSMEVQGTPLEVKAPKRRQWGRKIYLAIVIALMVVGANYVAEHVFWYSGQGVIGGQEHPLSPSTIGTVKNIEVKPGDHVRKGQILMSFSSPQFNEEVAQLEANIVNAETNADQRSGGQDTTIASLRAEISGLQSQYLTLEKQYSYQQQQIASINRLVSEGALNPGNVVSLQQKAMQTKAQAAGINAKIETDVAQLKSLQDRSSQLHSSVAAMKRVASLKKVLRSLRSKSGSMTLRSPINGVVAEVPVTVGQTVNPGKPAVIVAPSDNQRALLYFPPAAAAQLSKNKIVSVTAPNGRAIQMRIAHIYPSVQDLPQDLQSSVDTSDKRKVIAVAHAVNPRDIGTLQVGTPVTVHVARWKASRWIAKWAHVAERWIHQGIQHIG